MLTFEQIKELVELVAQRRLQGLEIERSGFRLKVDGQTQAQPAVQAAAPGEGAYAPPAPVISSMPADATAIAAAPKPAAADEGAHIVTSPIVGTFYEGASPGSPPFVRVGETVQPGSVLCIIESMKLHIPVESTATGTVTEVMAKEGDAVAEGQVLFRLET